MKTCTICKSEKELSEFNKNSTRKDGLNNICKTCSQNKSKQYYKKNKQKHVQSIRVRNRLQVQRNQNFVIRFLKRKKCCDCLESDIRVLEFDHVRGVKHKDVSILVSTAYCLQTLKEEIRKCDIVCANCHRKRTHDRANTYRSKAAA